MCTRVKKKNENVHAIIHACKKREVEKQKEGKKNQSTVSLAPEPNTIIISPLISSMIHACIYVYLFVQRHDIHMRAQARTHAHLTYRYIRVSHMCAREDVHTAHIRITHIMYTVNMKKRYIYITNFLCVYLFELSSLRPLLLLR